MRSIFSIIIACLLQPCLPIVVWSTEPQPVDSSQRKPADKKERDSDALDFSGTGRPGQQTAGESRASCSNLDEPIRAMLPESNSGKTVLGHPSFWVYFPESKARGAEVEFIVQDEERKDVWRSRSALNSRSGYQSFSIPQAEAPLEIGQWYRWYVKLYCGNSVASSQYIQGWVNRVPLNSKLYLELQQNQQRSHVTYANHGIWYEAVGELLSSYYRNPQNIALEQDWQNLVEANGVTIDRLPTLGGSKFSQQRN